MTKRDYTAAIKNFQKQKESVQNSYLSRAYQIAPEILESLPLDSYIHLTRNHNELKTSGSHNEKFHYQLLPMLFRDDVSNPELLILLPNADEKTLMNDFNDFKGQFFIWAKTYCLEKDWIYESALSTLAERREAFIEGKEPGNFLITSVSGSLNAAKPKHGIFIEESMNVFSENWTEFESRIQQKMKELKKQYKAMADKNTFKTKDFSEEKLEWLVFWNIKKMTLTEIAQKSFPNHSPEISPQAAEALESKRRGIYKAIQSLNIFDLPIRRGR